MFRAMRSTPKYESVPAEQIQAIIEEYLTWGPEQQAQFRKETMGG
jgi:hypothetical protein